MRGVGSASRGVLAHGLLTHNLSAHGLLAHGKHLQRFRDGVECRGEDRYADQPTHGRHGQNPPRQIHDIPLRLFQPGGFDSFSSQQGAVGTPQPQDWPRPTQRGQRINYQIKHLPTGLKPLQLRLRQQRLNLCLVVQDLKTLPIKLAIIGDAPTNSNPCRWANPQSRHCLSG